MTDETLRSDVLRSVARAGISRIEIQETTAALEGLIQQQSNPNLKEQLQVLYLLQ